MSDRIAALCRGRFLAAALFLAAVAGGAQATVTLTLAIPSPTEGTALTNVVVATFTTSDAGPPPASSFTAMIFWGDGTMTAATVSGPAAGTYSVAGSHTYADELGATFTVSVQDSTDSTTTTASGVVTVKEGDFGALFPLTFSATAGVAYNGPVGSFSDPGNPIQVPSDFTASIDWGDATVSAGVVTLTAGLFTISGTHTYATFGTFTVNARFSDDPPSTLTNITIASTANVTLPPAIIAKTFGAPSIPLNGTTTLSFTVINPNASNALTGVGFTDLLPAGLAVATPNGLAGSCGGGTITATAGSGSVTLAGATLAASASCTFSVNVTGVTAGIDINTTSGVSSVEGGTGNPSSAAITVVAPPIIAKLFGVAAIPVNGTTSLSFTITNPNASSALTGVGFTDALPVGLAVATPNGLAGSCGGGAITATAGSGSITLVGATLAAGASCTFSVNVAGTSLGTKNNTTGAVTSNEGGTGATGSASLVVALPMSAQVGIPTLQQWALLLLGMLLVGAATVTLRSRRQN